LATTGLGICTSLVTLFVTTSQPRGTAHGDGRFLRLVSLSAVLYPPSASSNDSVLHTPPTCFMHVRITIRISGAAQLMRQKSVKANKFLAHHRPGPSPSWPITVLAHHRSQSNCRSQIVLRITRVLCRFVFALSQAAILLSRLQRLHSHKEHQKQSFNNG